MTTPAPIDPDMLSTALSELRGYRLPEPVSWWPPAPGWWLLAFVVLLLIVALVWRWWIHRRQTAARRAALRELGYLRRQLELGGDAAAYLRAVSALLRRYVVTNWPRRDVAGLVGDAWLAFLDRHDGQERFTQGPGRLLADGPYRPVSDIPAARVADLVELWIRRNPGPAR